MIVVHRYFERKWGLLQVLLLLSMVGAACQDQIANDPKTLAKHHGYREWEWLTDSLKLHMIVGNLQRQGMGVQENILFEDSIKVQIHDHAGKQVVTLVAKRAISAFPFDKVRLEDFVWKCEDGSEIDGPSLLWNIGARDPIHMDDQVNLITDQGLVYGVDLSGDLLLRRYRIQKIVSVISWDAIAGGREGYQNSN